MEKRMRAKDEGPSRYEVTCRIIEEILRHRNRSGATITKDRYKEIKKKTVDQMDDDYNLDGKKRESLRKQYDRWFDDLGAIHLVHRKDPDSNKKDYDIYVAPVGPSIELDQTAIQLIAALSTSEYRDKFTHEMLEIPFDRIGARYVEPEFPEDHILQMLIPSLREMVVERYVERLPALLAQLQEELQMAQGSHNDKDAYRILRSLKRHSDFAKNLRRR